jgi:hypothetical protein
VIARGNIYYTCCISILKKSILGRGTLSTPGSICGSPTSSPRNEATRTPLQGPFPKGRRGLVEKSPLIRHPSWRANGQVVSSPGYQPNMDQKNVITAENHNFLKDVRYTFLLSILLNLLP